MLWKYNKIFEDTLSLRVTRSGTAHSSQYFANSFQICFADGICSLLNHILTVCAVNAQTWFKQEPAVPQCLLKLLSILHNLLYIIMSFVNLCEFDVYSCLFMLIIFLYLKTFNCIFFDFQNKLTVENMWDMIVVITKLPNHDFIFKL